MKRTIIFLALLLCGAVSVGTVLAAQYSTSLCNKPGFYCYKVVKGQSWEKLWPDQYERDLIQRINRVNIQTYPGMIVAVPQELDPSDPNKYAPFPLKINPTGEKLIVVSPSVLAWGAYNPQGALQFWGPISAGKAYCPDVGKPCRTPVGDFSIYRKGSEGCYSRTYPIETNGGAPMPYCMFFKGGAAMHGSPNGLVGYHASHGCVRMNSEDAAWLNENFIDLPGGGSKGTRVIVEPYNALPLSTLTSSSKGVQ